MMLRSRLTIKNSFILMSSIVVIAIMMTGSLKAQQNINREILPVVAPEPQTYTELDVRNTKPPKSFNVTAPEGATMMPSMSGMSGSGG